MHIHHTFFFQRCIFNLRKSLGRRLGGVVFDVHIIGAAVNGRKYFRWNILKTAVSNFHQFMKMITSYFPSFMVKYKFFKHNGDPHVKWLIKIIGCTFELTLINIMSVFFHKSREIVENLF